VALHRPGALTAARGGYLRPLMSGAGATSPQGGGRETQQQTPTQHRSSAPASTIGPWLPDGELGIAIADGLARVESALGAAVASDHAFVNEAAGHLMAAGGKRVRPMLALLAAQLGDAEAPEVVRAAVVCELTHLATLYHDDVMDEASVRRGAPSANSRWGNSVAILTGDLLFARASELLADLGPEAVRVQAHTFERLVTGQLRETVGARPGEDPVDHYLGVLADKTGSLVATSARFGASFAGVDPDLVTELAAFGEDFGVAFQLSDDLIDIVSEVGASGKSPGTDLREGIATLPVLFALAGDDPAEARLRALVAGPVVDDAEHAEALALLRGSASLARSTAVLEEYADRARARLTAVPDGPVRESLSALCTYVVTRTS
jgi:heptaprenyl diphosphate synthase